ncbi:hypothetical protein [Streptomyces antibioticus]|uniref:hypothetical protein n=1 Tax=Streptomyces antibioticus TaxID=1890 RepID=UPI00367EB1E6
MKPTDTPTPAVLARCGTPVPGGHCPAPAEPAAAVPVREPYDRHTWEAAVMASSLHRGTRLIAFVLAHYAGDAGYLPPGGRQHLTSLTASTGHNPRNCRLSLQQLENARFISRPPMAAWHDDRVRPVTLTLPPAGFRYEPVGQPHRGPRRTEPAHPGGAVA